MGGDGAGGMPDKPPASTYIPPDPDEDTLFEQDHEEGINFELYDQIPVDVTGNNTTLPTLSTSVLIVAFTFYFDRLKALINDVFC